MKVFFDTNVHIAEALLGRGARRILAATYRAKWRMYSSQYVIDEVAHVLMDEFDFGRRITSLLQRRILRRCAIVKVRSRARVLKDPKDSPILQAALSCGADYLVTNDRHLLDLHPFEGLEIISMDQYHAILRAHGILK